MRTVIGLICGVAPACDKCAVNDAKIQINLPRFGQRCLCESCVTELIEAGLTSRLPTKNRRQIDIGGHAPIMVNECHDGLRFVYANGEIVPPGRTVVPDHFIQVYTIQVRSMGGVSSNQLRDVIQTKYEVSKIDCVVEAAIVKR